MADTHEPASFADVLRYELEAVRRRRYEVRQAAGNPPDTPEDLDERVEKLRGKGIEELRGAALDDGMVGLALSGGGVRSATFGLGFLQGVSRLGLLSAVDYLSTVSGGGFVGGWLTAWIHREEQRLEAARKAGAAAGEVAGATANVEKQLHPDRKVEAQADRRVDVENPPGARDPDQSLAGLFPPPAGDPRPRPVLDDEPEPVYHLRAYSNYLAPRPSWFSGDMWTIFAIYFRNTLVNLLILVPVAFAAILLAYGLVWFFARADAAIGWWFTGFLLVAVVGAVYCLARSIVLLNRPRRPADPPPKHWHVLLQSRAGFVALMVAPTVVAAVLTTWLITLAPADAPPTPPAAAAAPAAAAEGTVEVTLDPKRPDKSGVVTVGPVKAVVKVAAPPQAPDPPPRKDKTLKLRYPWYDAVYPLLHWNRPVVDNNIGLVLLAFVTGFSLIGAGAALLWLVAYGFAAAGCLRRMAMLGSLAGAAAAGWAAAPSFAWAAVPPAVVLALWAFASAAGRFRDPVGGGWRNAVLSVSTPVVLAAGAGLLVGVVEELPLTWLAAYPAAVVTVGPPLILVALALAGFVEAAVLSKLLTAHDREWRSRLAATQALIGAAWLAFFGTVFFLPWAVRELSEFVGPKLQYGAVAGWVMTTVGGLFAANSAQSGKGGSRPPSRVLNLLTAVAPVVFLAGLLALLGVLAHDVVTTRLIEAPKPVDPATGQYAPPAPAAHPGPLGEWRVFARGADAAGGTFWWTLGLAGGCVGFAVGLSLLTDVNVFSMHALYGNRLVRGYLGASRRKVHATDEFPDGRLRDRGAAWEWVPGAGGAPTGVNGEVRRENPVTGFDKGDDVTLAALRFTPAKPATAARPATPARLAYRGPYHLIGTALNLRAGGELAVQDRRASSFVLSPGYCGSDETGYAATPEATGTGAPNLTLGRAMTISGAAADANMAVHESPAVTALMTVFNVRLGWWMENPRAAAEAGRTWAAGPPTAGMLSSLAREFLGLTHARGGYVHLSDGGHFDNTGVYELVRRRCRYVVQVDAAADPDDLFEDLAQLVRRVRADFGIRLEIDPTPVRRVGADRLSKWHVAVGRIRYDDVDADALAGTLVYVRASRTGDEPIDVRQYADAHPEFPHTSTLGDQFFDNDQFEAYRMLGEHVAGDVFEDAVQLAPRWPAAKAARASDYRRAVRSLFAEVHGRWYPPPVGIEAAFQQAGQDCAALMRQFREDEHLAGFVRDMYPELPLAPGEPPVAAAVRRPPADAGAADRTVVVDIQVARGAGPSPAAAGRTGPVELLAVGQLLDVMERAWHGVRLATHYDHPINRGWMNAFRRWSSSAAFHRAWPVVRGEYGQDFVRFCERALNLPAYRAVPRAATAGDGAQVRRLGEAFGREWGSRLGRVKAVAVRYARAQAATAAPANTPPPPPAPFFDGHAGESVNLLSHVVAQVLADAPAPPGGLPAQYAKAWLLDLREFGPDGAPPPVPPGFDDQPVGLLAVVPRGRRGGESHYEVVFWVRPPYRSLGLGRSAVEHRAAADGEPFYKSVLDGIRAAEPGQKVRLWSHYPSDLNTRGDRPQRGMWLNLCHDYDFRRHDPPPADAGNEPPWVSVKYDVT